jgi:hypothetical protein
MRDLAHGGLRLHPATVAALRGGGRRPGYGLAGIIAAGVLGLLLGLLL